MSAQNQVTVEVVGGSQVAVPWTQGMNAQDALEAVWNVINSTNTFTFGLQYYGRTLGYMVFMINETYDSYLSAAQPYYYWHFFVNDVPQMQGIDSTILQDGDRVKFSFDMYVPAQHAGTMLEAKFNFQKAQLRSGR
jgi:hypothetical protein